MTVSGPRLFSFQYQEPTALRPLYGLFTTTSQISTHFCSEKIENQSPVAPLGDCSEAVCTLKSILTGPVPPGLAAPRRVTSVLAKPGMPGSGAGVGTACAWFQRAASSGDIQRLTRVHVGLSGIAFLGELLAEPLGVPTIAFPTAVK